MGACVARPYTADEGPPGAGPPKASLSLCASESHFIFSERGAFWVGGEWGGGGPRPLWRDQGALSQEVEESEEAASSQFAFPLTGPVSPLFSRTGAGRD